MKWLSKCLIALVAVITFAVTTPQQAKAVPYDCTLCQFDFDLKNVVWYYSTYYNNKIPLDITWDVSHPIDDNNQAAWENAVLTPNAGGMSSLPIWDFASNNTINDQGRQEMAKLRMELTYPENEVVLADVVENTDINTGAIATMSSTVNSAVSAVSAMSTAVSAMTTALSTMEGNIPDDLGDLAEGSDSKHFTSALKTKLTDLPTASTLTSNLSAKADTSHTHGAADIVSGTLDAARVPSLAISKTTGLQAALDEKSNKSEFTSVTSLSAHGVSNGATDASTSVSADSVTILGISVPTNASYTDLVAEHNTLATKYNDLATKFNTILTYLGTSRTTINALKTAGSN